MLLLLPYSTLILSGVGLDELLRCQGQTIPDWREALTYGQRVGYYDYPVDGRVRHTLTLTYRKRLLLFVFMYPDQPGAIEKMPGGIAWHGCGMYEIAETFP